MEDDDCDAKASERNADTVRARNPPAPQQVAQGVGCGRAHGCLRDSE